MGAGCPCTDGTTAGTLVGSMLLAVLWLVERQHMTRPRQSRNLAPRWPVEVLLDRHILIVVGRVAVCTPCVVPRCVHLAHSAPDAVVRLRGAPSFLRYVVPRTDVDARHALLQGVGHYRHQHVAVVCHIHAAVALARLVGSKHSHITTLQNETRQRVVVSVQCGIIAVLEVHHLSRIVLTRIAYQSIVGGTAGHHGCTIQIDGHTHIRAADRFVSVYLDVRKPVGYHFARCLVLKNDP